MKLRIKGLKAALLADLDFGSASEFEKMTNFLIITIVALYFVPLTVSECLHIDQASV